MIEIKAEDMGKRTELKISIHGSSENIITEAVHIMKQLPKQLEEASKPLYLCFMAVMESDLYGEEEENEDDDD